MYHGVDTDRGVNADFHGYNFYQCTMVHPDQYGSSLVPSGRATFLVHHGAFGPVREPPLVPSGRATLYARSSGLDGPTKEILISSYISILPD